MTNDFVSSIRYNRVARMLHATIAALIIINLALGLGHDALEESLPSLMWWHKSLGLLILVLSFVRLFWRLSHRAPPFPATMPGWERASATLTHWAFYVLMIAAPFSGWIMASGGKNPISFFGIFDVPKFGVARGDPLWQVAHEGHELIGWIFLALIVLHVGAALRHHFILKDGMVSRMIGGTRQL